MRDPNATTAQLVMAFAILLGCSPVFWWAAGRAFPRWRAKWHMRRTRMRLRLAVREDIDSAVRRPRR